MRNIYLFVVFIVAAATLFAKQSPDTDNLDPFADKIAQAIYPEGALPGPVSEATAKQYLLQTLPHLAASQVSLQLVAHKTSPGGQHFTFEQYFGGFPVFNSQVKINIGHQGKVYSVFDNSYPIASWPNILTRDATAIEGFSLAGTLASFTGYAEAEIKEQAVLAVIGNQPAAYKMLQLYHAESGDHRLYLLDKTGNMMYNRDLNAYAGVPASAYVFNPDPITSAETVYLAPYVDSSDANTAVLRNERVMVSVEAKLVGGLYFLQNDYFVMADFSNPSQTVASSLTPAFLYNRSQSEFEEVNAYYHLNTFRDYIASLGFTTLTQDLVEVDAHALNGADNSQFSYGGGSPRLFFGDGGIDDAEDADVVIHEYGHALSYFGSPATNFGTERTALDEGFGDYFATSYSRSISNYRWADMFTWDGHNEYWNGRDAATNKVYPADLGGSIHRNGEMWATALMEVWSALGRDVADKLALQTLFSLASNMTFTDAALAYIQADNALYNGDNYNVIHAIMVNRGFLNGIGIAAIPQQDTPAFELHNSYGFSHGEAATLINLTDQPMDITVLDITGRAIKHIGNLRGDAFYLSGEQLPAGTYLLQVSAGGKQQVFRLVR